MTLRPAAIAAAVVVALLTGCAAQPTASSPSPSPTAASASATPTPTPTPTATPTAPPVDELTTAMRAVAGEHVVGATETEPGRYEIETNLTDPRGDSGSPEAQLAIGICTAVQQATGATYVNVLELDGSSWILYGHPLVPAGTCGEV